MSAGEINYSAIARDVANEEEKKGEDIDMEEPSVEVIVTVQ